MTRDIGEFTLVAHGVVEKLDATAFRDSVQSVGGGNAVEVGAAARATGSGVGVADGSVAGGGLEQGKGPLDITADKRECGGHIEENGDGQDDAKRREHGGLWIWVWNWEVQRTRGAGAGV